MNPIYLVGKLIHPHWVHSAVEANLALGNGSGKGNASLRRRGIKTIDFSPHPLGMNRQELAKFLKIRH